jgi:hypothetical protein
VLKTMFLNKLKGAAAALLVGLAICGTVLATFRAAAGDQENAKQSVDVKRPAASAAAPQAEPPAREDAPAVQAPVQAAGGIVVAESDQVESLVFSKDSRNLVGGSHGKDIRFWDMELGCWGHAGLFLDDFLSHPNATCGEVWQRRRRKMKSRIMKKIKSKSRIRSRKLSTTRPKSCSSSFS